MSGNVSPFWEPWMDEIINWDLPAAPIPDWVGGDDAAAQDR
jgi:hypothetical protein